VALQGTIDTFALADVLRLLGSTGKTGRVILDGDRGRGEVLLVEGAVKGLALGEDGAFDVHPADEAMFELLRFEDGDFVFDTDESARDHQGKGWEVESLLASADAITVEWAEIKQVVPSDRVWLSLTTDLPSAEVTIDADRWRLVAMIGSGLPVSVLAEALGATELRVGRVVRDLFEVGVIEIAPEAPLGAPARVLPVADQQSSPSTWFDETEAWASDVAGDDGARSFGVVANASNGSAAAETLVMVEVDADPATDLFDDDDTSAAEFARHLASLSPKAAQAVAAAARAESPEERERALAEVAASDENIDHDLLLRFLGETES